MESHQRISISKVSALRLLEDARLAAASRWRAQFTRPLLYGRGLQHQGKSG
jgi:hypothetical protein